MTAKELIQELSKVPEDTVIVGGVWNGRVNTYTVLDELHVFLFDEIYADFYGTLGAFDDKLLGIRSEKVAYLGSLFDSTDKRVMEDRFFIGRLRKILRMHRSREWKKEQIFQLLTAFDASDYDSVSEVNLGDGKPDASRKEAR